MSVSKRETANAATPSTDHHESNRKEMPGRGEIAVSAWQQVHTQSSSDVFCVPESASSWEPKGCAQQSWAAHALPPAIIRLTTRRETNPCFPKYRRNIGWELWQMTPGKVKGTARSVFFGADIKCANLMGF